MNSIKELRIKFIALAMTVLLVMLVFMFGVINYNINQSSVNRTWDLTEKVAEVDGIPDIDVNDENRYLPPNLSAGGVTSPEQKSGPKQGENQNPLRSSRISPEDEPGRFFYAKLDEKGNAIEINSSMIPNLSESDVKTYVEHAISTDDKKEIYGETRGIVDDTLFLIADKEYGKIIVFGERSIESNILSKLLDTSLIVFIIGIFIIFNL